MTYRHLPALPLLLALLLVGSFSIEASGSQFLATDTFGIVEDLVKRYVEKYGAKHVLLVVDIDNTLLAMDQDLGSDQWFEWQQFLLENEPESEDLVANSFEGLLDAQGLLYALGQMHPPEADQPALIGRLQNLGISTVVLTSRGDDFRAFTQRELVGNGYRFAGTALTVTGLPKGPYAPYDLENITPSGITIKEAEKFQLKPPRPVSYEQGLMLSAGQHKGAMLLTLLHHAEKDIQAVVFVDDHGRHVGRVFESLTDRNIEVTTVHYFHENDRVESFKYRSKKDVARRWRQVARLLEKIEVE